jgi:hypothetical protein
VLRLAGDVGVTSWHAKLCGALYIPIAQAVNNCPSDKMLGMKLVKWRRLSTESAHVPKFRPAGRKRREWTTNEWGCTHRTSSVAGIIYRSPMSEGRECWFGYSCLEELSGSMSDPTIQEGEWPEQAASWMLPDCEHIK